MPTEDDGQPITQGTPSSHTSEPRRLWGRSTAMCPDGICLSPGPFQGICRAGWDRAHTPLSLCSAKHEGKNHTDMG